MASDSVPGPNRSHRRARTRPSGCKFFFSAPFFFFLAGVSPVVAQTGIMIAPTRITLEPDEHSSEVFVMNQGNEAITARISLVNRHMREDGSFAEATTPNPGEYFADEFLQYAPRRVHLAPGQGQTVRILARPPDGRAPAEYRSHLLFRVEPPLPDDEDTPQEGDTAGNRSQMSIRLVPVYGVSIPVIVRTGPLTASASIDEVLLDRRPGQTPSATFRLHRSGNRSIYGDVRLLFQPHGGSERLIGESLGVAVYTPLPVRIVSVPLNRLNGDALTAGRLRIRYVDHDDHSRVLAEGEHIIP